MRTGGPGARARAIAATAPWALRLRESRGPRGPGPSPRSPHEPPRAVHRCARGARGSCTPQAAPRAAMGRERITRVGYDGSHAERALADPHAALRAARWMREPHQGLPRRPRGADSRGTHRGRVHFSAAFREDDAPGRQRANAQEATAVEIYLHAQSCAGPLSRQVSRHQRGYAGKSGGPGVHLARPQAARTSDHQNASPELLAEW